MKKVSLLFVAFILVSLLSSADSAVVRPEPIRLLTGKIAISTTEFYIEKVSDDRPDRSAVAMMFLAETGSKPARHAVDLYGGAYEAIRNFMLQSFSGNTAARPIHVRIKECNIVETLAGENRVSGQISVVFQFDLEKESGAVPLTRYKSEAKYTRAINNLSIVEPALRQLLTNSLKFINTWMNKTLEVLESIF